MTDNLTPCETAYRRAKETYNAAIKDSTHVDEAASLYWVAVRNLADEEAKRTGAAS
jgi:hypothetical protein